MAPAAPIAPGSKRFRPASAPRGSGPGAEGVQCRASSPTNSSGSSTTRGYLFLPDVFGPPETALLLREAHAIFACDRKEVVRERDGRTARTAFAAQHYKRGVPPPRAPSPARPPGGADPRRRGLHAPVQDQRQGGVRRGRVAMAPGLRRLVARRPHAGVPGHERRPVPGGRDGVQRGVDVHPPQPPGGRPWRPATTSRPRATPSGPSTTRPSPASSGRAASSPPRAGPARSSCSTATWCTAARATCRPSTAPSST